MNKTIKMGPVDPEFYSGQDKHTDTHTDIHTDTHRQTRMLGNPTFAQSQLWQTIIDALLDKKVSFVSPRVRIGETMVITEVMVMM